MAGSVKTQRVLLVVAWHLLAILAATGAGAMDRQDDIVVTARKRDEKADDVPIAVTKVTGATLDRRGLHQIEDLKQLAPSLNISYFNPRGNYVSIRGIGRNPASDGLEPAVGIFVDGVYLGRPGMAVYDLSDIDAVEILRGPQGTVFGKNTTAGAIVITSRAPTFVPEGSVETSVGTNGLVRFRGSVSTGLVDDVLAARLSVYHTGQGGWIDRLDGGGRLNGTDRTGARLQFLIEPDARLRLRLIAEYHDERDSCCTLVAGSLGPPSATYSARVAAAGGNAVLGGPGYRTTATAPTFLRVRQGGLTANLVYDLGAAEITSVTGYRAWHYRAGFDGDLSSAEAYTNASVPTDDWQFSQEVRIANPGGGRIDATAGLYYFRQSLQSALRLAFGAKAANFLGNTAVPPPSLVAFNGVTSSTEADLNSQSVAVFAQGTWHFHPRLALTIGARGTYERKSGVIDRPANAAQSSYHQALAVEEVDPSGTLALTYARSRDLHLYASYARGAKAGGINPIVATATDDQIVRPEHADSFELGLKSSALGGHVHFDLALFYTRIGAYQATLNRLFGAILANVGRVSTRGVEMEARWRASSRFEMAMTAAYNDAHYDSYPTAPCPPETLGSASCDLSGGPLADAPRWILNGSARYTRQIAASGTVSVGFDYGYRSHYYGNIDNSRYSRLGNVGIANAQLGFTDDRSGTSLQLWIKNLADIRYLESYPLGGATIYGAYFGTIGQPRSIGLTASRHF